MSSFRDFLRILAKLRLIKSKAKKFLRDNRIISHPSRIGAGTEASRLLNQIISLKPMQTSYREVGIERGYTFEAVCAAQKTGVDPHPLFRLSPFSRNVSVFRMYSDDFFKNNYIRNFDLIYLDGLHTFDQTYRDFKNAIACSSANAVIVIDDTIPSDEYSSDPDQARCYESRILATGKNDGTWHGDVYKLIVGLNAEYSHIFNIATLVDLENPKTVVWFKNSYKLLKDLNFTQSYMELTYSEIFGRGIPDEMNPRTTSNFISELSDSLSKF